MDQREPEEVKRGLQGQPGPKEAKTGDSRVQKRPNSPEAYLPWANLPWGQSHGAIVPWAKPQGAKVPWA